MSRCAKVEPLVKEVLEEIPETRADDFLLVLEVYRRLEPEVTDLNFEEVMRNHHAYRLPYFESIRRSRPKLQNKYPNLLPPQEVQEARMEEEAEFRAYALDME